MSAVPHGARADKMPSPTRRSYVPYIALALAIGFFLIGSDQWMSIANYMMIYAIATLGLNVLSGYAGQVSLGLAFFMAVGAYTAAWLGGAPPESPRSPVGLGLSFLLWLPASGIVAALVGALVGPVALRLKNFYLGIVSLSLVFIGQYIFQNARSLTGGPQGRSVLAPSINGNSFVQQNDFFGVAVTKEQQFFLLLAVILGLASVFVANVARSRPGRAFQAVRDNEVGAAIMGINLFKAKLGAFILSSFLAGIAGALLASYIGYVRPDDWSLLLSIQFVAAIIIGGVASVWGSFLGAAFVFALPQVLDQLAILPQNSTGHGITSSDLSAILYGMLIIVFLLFEPGGIIGLVRRFQPALTHDVNAVSLKGGESFTEGSTEHAYGAPLDVEHSALSRDESE
ncbi:MAG: branched-chain amino acid ABC transporter permease [Ktedonobacterales bacterium]